MSFVSVYAQFTLKDKPEGYLGITNEQWSFGKDSPLSFSELGYAIISRLAEFTYQSNPELTAKEINRQIALLADGLLSSGIQE